MRILFRYFRTSKDDMLLSGEQRLYTETEKKATEEVQIKPELVDDF